MHDVNLDGCFNTMQIACKGMVKDKDEWSEVHGKPYWGRVVTIASQAGKCCITSCGSLLWDL